MLTNHRKMIYRCLLHVVIDLIPAFLKILLISRIHHLAKEWVKKDPKNNKEFRIPLRYAFYNTIAGAADK